MTQKEYFQLLMEETGCKRSEAELALELSSNNFEKAITTIGFILKFITTFKMKIIFLKENIYGLIHIAVNIKTAEIARFSVTFSCNPTIYEITTNIDWFSYEKAIFSARLNSGVMETYTKETEEKLKTYIQKSLKELIVISPENISSILKTFFQPNDVYIEIENEELNLTQFKKLPDYSLNQNLISSSDYDLGFVKLDVKVLEDNDGKSVKKIAEGDTVLSIITDERDLTHYIAHLIGGIDDGKICPIPATVKKILHKDNDFEIYLNYTTSIVGLAKTKSSTKVKVLEPKHQLWWKKMLPWRDLF
ncbi:MAG: hypothetical protein LBL16_01955 [Endomicrobium sp.]|jgi:hypothetical protein|nr:hypothetical protein [Endomicrobium sp.]